MNKLTPEIIGWAQHGVVPAALKIAAAMEESGLGAEIPPGSNNWFGIKGSGPATDTKEQTAGGVWYTVKSGFHMFKTPADGFAYYDWMISTGAPYAAAWKAWLASPKGVDDVETLTRSVAVKYATALAYAKALVSIEVADKLFSYDQGTTTAAGKPAPSAPVADAPPAATPVDRIMAIQSTLDNVSPTVAHEGFLAELEAFLVKWRDKL